MGHRTLHRFHGAAHLTILVAWIILGSMKVINLFAVCIALYVLLHGGNLGASQQHQDMAPYMFKALVCVFGTAFCIRCMWEKGTADISWQGRFVGSIMLFAGGTYLMVKLDEQAMGL